MEAPGSVVGYQFSHALMLERFLEITNKVNVSIFIVFSKFLIGFCDIKRQIV